MKVIESNMKNRFGLLFALAIIVMLSSLASFGQSKIFNIVDFGAKSGLDKTNTIEIQKAIDAAAKVKGKVIIPSGQFVTGPLRLKSGIELILNDGAELLGSTNRLAYGNGDAEPLISAFQQESISISGNGIINGRGAEVVKNLLALLHQGTLKDKTWTAKRPDESNRPRLIAFSECRNISVKNITIKNSAGWVQDFANCVGVKLDSLKIESTVYWNNDGIDVVNCKDVSITNCDIDAADDGICLKSEGTPGICENIYVANCKIRSSANGFKLGTGSAGGFRNIKVRNITVYNTFRSAIALEAVDGGFIDGIDIQGVVAKYTGNAIFIRLGHRNTTASYSTLKNVKIVDVIADIPSAKPDAGYPLEGPLPKSAPHNLLPIVLAGIPGHQIENILLENISVSYGGGASKAIANIPLEALDTVTENESGYPEFSMFGELPAWGIYVRHAKNLKMKNIKLNYFKADFRTPIVFDDVDTLDLNGLVVERSEQKHSVALKNVTNFSIKNANLPRSKVEQTLKL